VVVIAFTPPWPFALVCAATPPVAVALFLPLGWFRLALGAQATKPFRLSRLVVNGAIVVMACIFLAEVVQLIVLYYLTFGDVMEPGNGTYAMAISILCLGVLNALAGLLGVAWSVRTYERARCDLVKTPTARPA
jgi:hypothetical protein